MISKWVRVNKILFFMFRKVLCIEYSRRERQRQSVCERETDRETDI